MLGIDIKLKINNVKVVNIGKMLSECNKITNLSRVKIILFFEQTFYQFAIILY